MGKLLQDLAYGIRMMRKSPGFAAVAVLTLALGIGANTAIFGIIDAVALRPLAVEDAARIVRIRNQKVNGAYDSDPSSSWPEYQEFRSGSRALSGIAAADRRGAIFRYNNEARHLLADVTSPNYFDVLRVEPAAGRMYAEAELKGSDAPNVAVFSYDFWKRQFQGDSRIVGSTVSLNGIDCMVAGVLPREYRGTEPELNPEVYFPLSTWDAMNRGFQQYARRDFRELELFGRLQTGATAGQAQVELATIQRRLAAEFPKTDTDRRITVISDRGMRIEQSKDVDTLLLGIAGLVLLIACANVANLLLARGESRRKEIATRLALGAGRLRLLRQCLTETLPLAIVAALFAFVLAGWIIRLLPALLAANPYVAYDFRVDGRVLAFAFAISLLAVFAAGLFPAFSSTRVSLVGVMKDNVADDAGRRGVLRNALVVTEIALSAVLLIGAGLLVRTLIAVRGQDPGFDTHGRMLILTFADQKNTRAQNLLFYSETLRRLPAMPGVRSAAFASRIPMWGSGGGANKVVWVPGIRPAPGEEGVRIGFATVMGDYFDTVGTRILRGRAITSRDTENTPRVAVVNETAARLLWPGQDPIGKHFRDGGPEGKDVEVVGLAPDGRYNDLREKHKAYMFLAELQQSWDVAVLLVGTRSDPRAELNLIRRELKTIDANVDLLSALTMDDHMRYALYEDRTLVQLATALGALGLVLAVVGLYGVVSYMVSRRTREIGIRIAVGAKPLGVFGLILMRGLVLAGIGVGVGVAGAAVASRYAASLLYGIDPRDPLTFSAVVVILFASAMLGTIVPAYRATRVDPIVALREG